jgi:hypothetical protein
MARWCVNFVRLAAEYVGTVAAASERDALAQAAKVFDLDPVRLVLTKFDDIDQGRVAHPSRE